MEGLAVLWGRCRANACGARGLFNYDVPRIMKRPAEDKLFSDLIRCRAGWRCQYVGRKIEGVECTGSYIPESDRQALHCSHILGRSRRATRWHPWNALSLCAPHHAHMGMNPLEHAALAYRILGDEKHEALLVLGAKTVRFKKHDLADLRDNLKASWQDMQARIEAGETDLEFESPLPEHLT